MELLRKMFFLIIVEKDEKEKWYIVKVLVDKIKVREVVKRESYIPVTLWLDKMRWVKLVFKLNSPEINMNYEITFSN